MTYSVPQGSVLGPKFYVMYTKPVGAICRKHGLNTHFYADDSQLYLSFKPTNTTTLKNTINQVTNCLNDIIHWMNNNMLKLNSDKTELIVFTSDHNANTVSDISVKVDNSEIMQSTSVRNLGAFFDSKMNMDQHVTSACRSIYAQLRQVSRIRQYMNTEATKSLINALVTSRLDYCNALLHGLPKTTINKLQLVQNNAARIISRSTRYSHITPILQELHWLPVQYRVNYKILTHTFKALHDQSPVYIKDMLHVYRPSRNLRSGHQSLTLVPLKTKQAKYGERSFSAAAPKLWNVLPATIRACKTLQSFKSQLKTYYFKQVYLDQC